MIIEIPKGTPETKIKKILTEQKQTGSSKSIAAFFGKLPGIGDGLTFQKKVRNEWK